MILTYFNNILFNKFFLLFAFFLIFSFPIISYINLIFLIFFLLLISSIEEFKKNIEIKYLILIIFLSSFSYLIEKKTIIENHAIFLPNEKNQEVYLATDPSIFNLLIKDFYNSYSENDLTCKDEPHNCWDDFGIGQVYAKSFDQLNFDNVNYSRKINSINHTNLANARIGDINTIKFNWFTNSNFWWDKEKANKIKRINAPYIIQYDFTDEKYSKSKICWQGKALINKKALIVDHKRYECNNITKNFNIIFFNFDNILKVKLIKSYDIIIIDLLLKFTKILALVFLIYFFIKKINFNNLINKSIILLFSSSVLIYTIIDKKEFSFGYNPLQGGMDGLVHEGFGRNIINHILNFNFFEALKGSENIFYFMPGLRYFSAVEKILFGDTFFGIYIILIFFPIVFYLFLLNLGFGKKISMIIILLFIFLKIPHLGFSYHHYIINFLTVYPGTLAIFFFFLTMITNFKKKYFLSGLFCSVMVFLRPNYLPVYTCLLIFNSFIAIKDNNNKRFFIYLLGSAAILLLPLHNFVYGNGSLVFLTSSANINLFELYDERVHPLEYVYLFKDLNNFIFIKDHLLHFITTGQDNYLVFCINLILFINIFVFMILFFKKTDKIYLLFCIISIVQQFPALFYPNQGRYALFPWLLILITNFLISKKYLQLFKNRKF